MIIDYDDDPFLEWIILDPSMKIFGVYRKRIQSKDVNPRPGKIHPVQRLMWRRKDNSPKNWLREKRTSLAYRDKKVVQNHGFIDVHRFSQHTQSLKVSFLEESPNTYPD
jgi:hypothetical protein